jgi:hypothetical protein
MHLPCGWTAGQARCRICSALGEFVSIDCEDDEEGYFLGALTALGADAADMRHIGTDGTWEDSDWTVDYDDITRISFGTRYIQVFSRLAGDLPSLGPDFRGEGA